MASSFITDLDSIFIKVGHECKSADKHLGKFDSVGQSRNACKYKRGCKFFIYGTNSKNIKKNEGQCYWEKTSDSSCPEGWEEDEFDFYKLMRKFIFYHFNFSSLND